MADGVRIERQMGKKNTVKMFILFSKANEKTKCSQGIQGLFVTGGQRGLFGGKYLNFTKHKQSVSIYIPENRSCSCV